MAETYHFRPDKLSAGRIKQIREQMRPISGYGKFNEFVTEAVIEKWQRENPEKERQHRPSTKRLVPTGYEDATTRLEATKSMRKTIDRIKDTSDAKTTRQAVDVAACYAKMGAVTIRFLEKELYEKVDELLDIKSKEDAQRYIVKYGIDFQTLDSLLYTAKDIIEEKFLIPRDHLKPPIAHTLDIYQAKIELGEEEERIDQP